MGDKAFSHSQIPQYVRHRGIRVIIPRKLDEHRTGRIDRSSHRQRNEIERLMNRYKPFRRIATRYEKRAANYQARWAIAPIVLWVGFANTP